MEIVDSLHEELHSGPYLIKTDEELESYQTKILQWNDDASISHHLPALCQYYHYPGTPIHLTQS